MIPENYLDKIYGGFLGMNVGIRLGAPVEPLEWNPERIADVYGDIRSYVKDYKKFSADDDVNGPVFFIRALYDDAKDGEIVADDIGKAWLNYTRDGIGMFWWGGEGISTEHTAYLNLQKGIKAPKSGSAAMNGLILSEQIGGQIFIDTWGLLFPNQADKAAKYAEIAASVSHDKNGLYGARFIAACIAEAFNAQTIQRVIEAGLATIPSDSTYAHVVKAVRDFHHQYPNDFMLCRAYLENHWGYDKYLGICHIIPNAGVCVLSLLYGEGDFARTIEIATMCGWDTDCNAGNVGSILGVMTGINSIPAHYRKPINDSIVLSSFSGYLNIMDIPTFSKELALLGYKVNQITAPQQLNDSLKEKQIYFDFNLPGSTHGFETDFPFKLFLRHSEKHGFKSKGCLEIVLDRLILGDRGKVFYKPFYRRSDFNDEKYKPTFAPKAYSGQMVSFNLFVDQIQGESIKITPYIRPTFHGTERSMKEITLKNKQWNEIDFQIPDTGGDMIDEVGFFIESPSSLLNRAFGSLFLDEFQIFGHSNYTIDFAKQSYEFLSITPFSHHKGQWEIVGNKMLGFTLEDCSSFTGSYYLHNTRITTRIIPKDGYHHSIVFRAKGIHRNYKIGFNGVNKVSLLCNDFGYTELISVRFVWNINEEYLFELVCLDSEIQLFINKKEVIAFKDDTFREGMFGYSIMDKGSALFFDVGVKEL